MKQIVFILVLFIISIAATYFACLPQLNLMNEGMDLSDLKIVLPCILVFIGVIALWIWLWRRYSSTWIKLLGLIVILQAALPLLLSIWVTGILLWQNERGKQQSANARITHYSDSFITWPGFSEPVGLHITINLPSPFAKEGSYAGFYSPVIWMGPALNAETRRHLFFNFPRTIPGNKETELLTLQRVLSAKQPLLFVSATTSKLVFDLYVSEINYFQSQKAFCTDDTSSLHIQPTVALDTHPHGMWFYVGATHVDLSDQLNQVLQHSVLVNQLNRWENMHDQFSDEHLLQKGYKFCELNSRKHCFCK